MRFCNALLAQQASVYTAAVVGAGPAGVAAVGQLLDSGITHSLSWTDPHFKGGRLLTYREVPRYVHRQQQQYAD